MGCVGCELKAEAMEVDVDQLIEEQLGLEIDLVAAEIREQRVAQCLECPFRSLHTCVKCGCYYKFRASLAHKQCPAGKW